MILIKICGSSSRSMIVMQSIVIKSLYTFMTTNVANIFLAGCNKYHDSPQVANETRGFDNLFRSVFPAFKLK